MERSNGWSFSPSLGACKRGIHKDINPERQEVHKEKGIPGMPNRLQEKRNKRHAVWRREFIWSGIYKEERDNRFKEKTIHARPLIRRRQGLAAWNERDVRSAQELAPKNLMVNGHCMKVNENKGMRFQNSFLFWSFGNRKWKLNKRSVTRIQHLHERETDRWSSLSFLTACWLLLLNEILFMPGQVFVFLILPLVRCISYIMFTAVRSC